MLTSLHISDMLLIKSLALDVRSGLAVLTGETGAGKSILLDALGLALGGRADNSLIRGNAESAQVTACFSAPAPESPLGKLLHTHGLATDANHSESEDLLIRRTLHRDSASRAFVNDKPCSAALLREIASHLVEIHGQNDGSGLLSASRHRALLDSFGACDTGAVQAAYAAWQSAENRLADHRARLAEAQRDREWLDHCLAELQSLAPQAGEEEQLANQRAAMQKGERLAEDLATIRQALAGSEGAPALLRTAARQLHRLADEDESLTNALAALDRAIIDIDEAEDHLAKAADRYNFDPAQLEDIEARLFDLRAMARKHAVQPDALVDLAASLAERHTALESGEQHLRDLEQQVSTCAAAYQQAAERLSAERRQAAEKLDAIVAGELEPLKLAAAHFSTAIEPLPRERWGAQGLDRVEFTIATNVGADLAPLAKIASGGELSRFILALKVALAEQGGAETLIFDEIDRGVGGAVASAVGARLAQLAREGKQLLVVTHSPQVAARGDAHYLVSKETKTVCDSANMESAGSAEDTTDTAQPSSISKQTQATYTYVRLLDEEQRHEEIARMLSGAKVTDEARGQARRLIEAM